MLDDGARRAIEKQGRSLLAIGIVERSRPLQKGGRGLAARSRRTRSSPAALINYAAEEVTRIKGLKTDAIATALGHCPYEEVIHRDNMAVTTPATT